MNEKLEPDALLGKVKTLKEAAAEYTTKLDDAKSRRAVVKDKMEELNKKLSAATGSLDTTRLKEAVAKAGEAAKAAAGALAEALDGLDLDDF